MRTSKDTQMEASEITRRNEAIARYMGLEYEDASVSSTKRSSDKPNMMWVYKSTYYFGGQLKYHRRWSWIMPVVDQIVIQAGLSYRILRDDFGDGVFYMCDFDPEHYGSYAKGMRGFGKTMIEAAWMAVSD